MSWSVTVLGTADKLTEFFNNFENSITDPTSKSEFLEAKPHILGLLSLEVNQQGIFKVTAAGHASFAGGADVPRYKTNGYLFFNLEQIYGQLA